jgi:hypothetical protein
MTWSFLFPCHSLRFHSLFSICISFLNLTSNHFWLSPIPNFSGNPLSWGVRTCVLTYSCYWYTNQPT